MATDPRDYGPEEKEEPFLEWEKATDGDSFRVVLKEGHSLIGIIYLTERKLSISFETKNLSQYNAYVIGKVLLAFANDEDPTGEERY